MARLNSTRSRVRPASCSRMRIAQISLSLKGGFGPTSLPLFQGSNRTTACFVCSICMVRFPRVVEEPPVGPLLPRSASRQERSDSPPFAKRLESLRRTARNRPEASIRSGVEVKMTFRKTARVYRLGGRSSKQGQESKRKREGSGQAIAGKAAGTRGKGEPTMPFSWFTKTGG